MRTIFEEVIKKALPVMEAYQNDLNIDRNTISLLTENTRYIHYTGTTGTYLELLPDHDSELYPPKGERIPFLFGTADRDHILNSKTDMIDCLKRNNRSTLIQYYNGKVAYTITIKQAEAITREYADSIKNSWYQEEKKLQASSW
jgi:hypothetical protein